MKSLWEREAELPSFPKLEGEERTDVLIVGGGMAGVLCAWFLQKQGVRYCLVEAGRVACRETGHTTAKITAQHGLVYHEIAERYGLAAAAQYYRANQAAVEQYRELCKVIDCEWEEKDNYVYSVMNREKLEREMGVLERIRATASFAETLPLPFGTCGAVCFPKQAQFHPLNFLKEIVAGLKIFERTKVLSFENYTGQGNYRKVKLSGEATVYAKKIIIAAHFPMINKHGMYFVKLYQHRSYVTALMNAPCYPGMYVDEDKAGFSFRNAGEYLLFGGGGHRTGKSGGGFTELQREGGVFFPEAEEICRWAAQDCMSLDGIPYIGSYSKGTRDLYVATGFNKWGMTSSMVAASVLADLVQEKKNEYETLFSTARSMFTKQLAVNFGESAMGLLSFSKPRCPHLGCALYWNREEHSWDCPCHGSRFAESGTVLENPANDDLKKVRD